eukprot:301855-Prorocentrum_minimum.AAC.1
MAGERSVQPRPAVQAEGPRQPVGGGHLPDGAARQEEALPALNEGLSRRRDRAQRQRLRVFDEPVHVRWRARRAHPPSEHLLQLRMRH